MNIRELSVEPREGLGKGAAGRLRRQGLVPAILYGGGNAPVPLAVVPTEVQRTIHGHGAGGVLREPQAGRATPSPGPPSSATSSSTRSATRCIHVDLQEVRMDEQITVEVPIHVVGEAVGVKDQSGILDLLLRDVEVSCLPSLIPERIDVDVSALRIDDVADRRRPPAPGGRPRDDARPRRSPPWRRRWPRKSWRRRPRRRRSPRSSPSASPRKRTRPRARRRARAKK